MDRCDFPLDYFERKGLRAVGDEIDEPDLLLGGECNQAECGSVWKTCCLVKLRGQVLKIFRLMKG
jgi:hypothetical protein